MPQTKKTVGVHLVCGTFRPGRHKRRQPDADTIGAPPGHLPDGMEAAWREVAAALPHGVGSRADRVSFELLVRLVWRMRAPEGLTAAETAQAVRLLDSFGLTPRGRQQLDPEPPPEPEGPKTGLAAFR